MTFRFYAIKICAPLLLVIFALFLLSAMEPALANAKSKAAVSLGVLLAEFVIHLGSSILSGINSFWALLLVGLASTWSKLACGVVLMVGGAFFPEPASHNKSTQSGVVEVTVKKFLFKGGPRLAVCFAGLLLIFYSLKG